MQPSRWRTTVYTIIIALAIGGASGVLGTALTSSYLSEYALQLSELTAPLRLSQERPRNFPSSYKEAVEKFVTSSLPAVAEVYQGAPGVLGYVSEDRFRVGVILTSDGWLAVETAPTGPFNLKEARVRIRGQVYPVVESAYDDVTRMIFLKVDASGLSVAAFGKGSDTQLGEQVFVARGPSAFTPASITQHVWPDATLVSSDEPNRFLLVDEDVEPGSIVFDLNGEAVAIAQEQGRLLPIESVTPALRSLLEKQEIIRPSLGVQYIDLTHAIDIPVELSRSYRHGALLYSAASVPRSSAARAAGLKPGDILLSINGELINGTYGLDELIAQYRAGDRVQIAIDRKGETQTIEVEL